MGGRFSMISVIGLIMGAKEDKFNGWDQLDFVNLASGGPSGGPDFINLDKRVLIPEKRAPFSISLGKLFEKPAQKKIGACLP